MPALPTIAEENFQEMQVLEMPSNTLDPFDQSYQCDSCESLIPTSGSGCIQNSPPIEIFHPNRSSPRPIRPFGGRRQAITPLFGNVPPVNHFGSARFVQRRFSDPVVRVTEPVAQLSRENNIYQNILMELQRVNRNENAVQSNEKFKAVTYTLLVVLIVIIIYMAIAVFQLSKKQN